MSKETMFHIVLIIIALGLAFKFFVAPVLTPELPTVVSEENLVPAGVDQAGNQIYYQFSEPVNWSETLKSLSPFAIALLPYILKKRNKK